MNTYITINITSKEFEALKDVLIDYRGMLFDMHRDETDARRCPGVRIVDYLLPILLEEAKGQ